MILEQSWVPWTASQKKAWPPVGRCRTTAAGSDWMAPVPQVLHSTSLSPGAGLIGSGAQREAKQPKPKSRLFRPVWGMPLLQLPFGTSRRPANGAGNENILALSWKTRTWIYCIYGLRILKDVETFGYRSKGPCRDWWWRWPWSWQDLIWRKFFLELAKVIVFFAKELAKVIFYYNIIYLLAPLQES